MGSIHQLHHDTRAVALGDAIDAFLAEIGTPTTARPAPARWGP